MIDLRPGCCSLHASLLPTGRFLGTATSLTALPPPPHKRRSGTRITSNVCYYTTRARSRISHDTQLSPPLTIACMQTHVCNQRASRRWLLLIKPDPIVVIVCKMSQSRRCAERTVWNCAGSRHNTFSYASRPMAEHISLSLSSCFTVLI